MVSDDQEQCRYLIKTPTKALQSRTFAVQQVKLQYNSRLTAPWLTLKRNALQTTPFQDR